MDGQVLSLYYDHYKQSDELCRDAQKRRNKEFIAVCVLVSLLFLMSDDSSFVFNTFNEVIGKEYGITTAIGWQVLQTLTWMLLAYYSIRYIQDVLYVERMYSYIASLEDAFKEVVERRPFGREGQYYAYDYPAALNIITLFYMMVCPLLLLVLCIAHIITEWRLHISVAHLAIDTSLCSIIVAVVTAYFFRAHPVFLQSLRKTKPIEFIITSLIELLRKV